MKRSHIWFALMILGTVVPGYFLMQSIVEQGGFDAVRFFGEVTRTTEMRFINGDLGMTGLTVGVFAYLEGRRLGMKRWWVPLLGALLVGISLALPWFLWEREKWLEREK